MGGKRNCEYMEKSDIADRVGNGSLPGLEGATDMSAAAGCGGNPGAAVVVGKSGVYGIGTGWRYWSRCSAAFHCMAFTRAGRHWRRHDAGGQRNIFGILGKYGTSADSVTACGGRGALPDSCLQKETELPDAISAIFAGSLSAAAHMKNMKVQGSLTIEAALIIPLVLLVFGLAMSSGIILYTECRDTAAGIREEKEFDAVETFYRWQGIGDIIGDGD